MSVKQLIQTPFNLSNLSNKLCRYQNLAASKGPASVKKYKLPTIPTTSSQSLK